MQELIKQFMSLKRFTAVGATDNPQQYDNQTESETAITYCHENNLKVVHSVCVMLS